MAGMITMKSRGPRLFLGSIALGAIACLNVVMSPPSSAQSGAPWKLGRIDQSYVWAPRVNVVPAIDACHANQPEVQPTWTGRSYELPPPICLLRVMRAGGASPNAMAFARSYSAHSEGDEAFIINFYKPRFGVVSIAEIELPGRADNNWYYIFVNGKPVMINPEEEIEQLSLRKNATFLAITRVYPTADVFADEAFVGESTRPRGGQRFTIAAPIVDGCHACSRVGIVYMGFDFGADGSARAPVITAVHRCPLDARCKSSFSFAIFRGMFYGGRDAEATSALDQLPE